MKTYEEEYKGLVAWCRQANEEAEKEIAQLPKMDGYDDRATAITLKVDREWGRRLRELNDKYGKPHKVLKNGKIWIEEKGGTLKLCDEQPLY